MNTDTMATFAEQVEEDLLAHHARLEAGEITTEEFILLATALLVRAKARGVALADLAAAAELSALRGITVPAVGLPVPDGVEEATTLAVEEMLTSASYVAGAAAAVAVLGRSQALAAVQEATLTAYREHGVSYWTRVVDSGACEVCIDLADGVMPTTAAPWHHKGCGCSTQPVETD